MALLVNASGSTFKHTNGDLIVTEGSQRVNWMTFRQFAPGVILIMVLQLALLAALGFPAPAIAPAKAAPLANASPGEPLAGLTAQSDLIVRGQVIGVTSAWSANHRWIESAATVAVRYALAGAAPPTVTIFSEGGYLPVEGMGMRASHAASFALGEEVLLFLRRDHARLVVTQEENGKLSVAHGVAANGALRWQASLATVYAAATSALQHQARAVMLPADWQSQEPAGNAVEPAAPSDFVFEDLRWPDVSPQIFFRANPFGPETGGPDGSAEQFLAALTNPAITWSVVPGAALAFFYEGPTPATDVDYNGINEVIFFPAGQNSVAGRARIWFDQNRFILEADLWLNSDLDWDATGDPATVELDVESAAIHEFGHWLGLGHDSDPNAVMYPSLTIGTLRRALHPSDIAGITYIYPCPATPCIPDEYQLETPTPTVTASATSMPGLTPTATETETPTNTPTPSPTDAAPPTATATLSPTQPATPTLVATLVEAPGGPLRTFLPMVGK
jgi:hypothetical protein